MSRKYFKGFVVTGQDESGNDILGDKVVIAAAKVSKPYAITVGKERFSGFVAIESKDISALDKMSAIKC